MLRGEWGFTGLVVSDWGAVVDRVEADDAQWQQWRTSLLAPGRAQKSLAEHEKIVLAIASGNRAAAEKAMREHLTNVASTLANFAAPSRIAM